ncbi:MAG TPA: MarR family transcriptional regulator [Chloroflexota bacterium]|nr:MarR family transcriptional regulator [Chloroflexota bacterium]
MGEASETGGAGSPAADAGREAVAGALHSAAVHLLRRLRREDDASGLSAPRLSALSVVVFGGPLTLGALAAAEQVRPPTMTRIVSALEADGLVQREPGPRDGRVTLVRATPAGTRLLLEGRDRRTAVLAAGLGALTGAELDVLARAAALMEALARGSGRGAAGTGG